MAGMIPPEIVEQVRQAVDIVDVIGGYVPLKRSGAKFKALSPFNKEKTPSFFVDPARQIFKCFSSGHGGDVFKFLMVHDHMTFPEAVRRLAQRANVVIPENGPHDPEARSKREELYALYAGVAAWWHKLLMSDPAADPARTYLKSREMDSALADEFDLGYAPDGWDATLTWARKAGYSDEALNTAKLVATSESGKRYDFFRGRLMIPIHDENGQVVAFSGRLLDANAKAQKYVNSPESPIFSKSRILFGLNRAKRPIIEADSAILCEGQIDLMRCWQKGVRNVVAPQGTAFTDEQARKLKRLAKEVVICFDADDAGQKAAQRAIDVLLKEDVQIRIARIPQGEDPDSLLLKNPVSVFETILAEAKDYTRHLLDVACAQEDVASPRGRGLVAQKMAQVIARIPNAVQRETFLLEVARRLQVPRNVVEEEVRKAEAQQKRGPVYENGTDSETASAAPEPAAPLQPDKLIEALLLLLLAHPDLVPEVTRTLNTPWYEDLDGAPLLQQLLEAHAHDGWEDAAQFLDQCDDAGRDYLAGLLMANTPEEAPDLSHLGETGMRYERYRSAIGSAEAKSPAELAQSFVQLLEARWYRRRLEMLEQSVKSGLLPVAEVAAIFQEMQAIKTRLASSKRI